jgi:hypothetical protein
MRNAVGFQNPTIPIFIDVSVDGKKNLNIESRKIKKLKPLCKTQEQFNHSFNNQICVSVSGNPREKL